MSIAASESGSEIRVEEPPSTMPRFVVLGLVFAGVYAVIKLRERVTSDPFERAGIPDSLREDVGLPRREAEPRGWWEWR